MTTQKTMAVRRGLVALLAGLPAALIAATPPAAMSPEAIYSRDRALCESGRSAQDRPTCLKEAGAALAEARRGQLKTAGDAQLLANAMARCQQVPVDDRAACETMARGGGQRSGSVAQGAVIKEVVTPIIPPASAASR